MEQIWNKIWNKFGTNLEQIWNKFGTNLEQIWNKFGTNLEQIWNKFETFGTFGKILEHLEQIWNIWKKIATNLEHLEKIWNKFRTFGTKFGTNLEPLLSTAVEKPTKNPPIYLTVRRHFNAPSLERR